MRHNRCVITASTEPDTTDYPEWVVLASSIINNFLHVTSDVADPDGSLKTIADDLCMQKYTYEKLTGHIGSVEILNVPQPALTVEHKIILSNMQGADDEPAYTRRMGMGMGGGGAELD